jgi:hypothetical protein
MGPGRLRRLTHPLRGPGPLVFCGFYGDGQRIATAGKWHRKRAIGGPRQISMITTFTLYPYKKAITKSPPPKGSAAEAPVISRACSGNLGASDVDPSHSPAAHLRGVSIRNGFDGCEAAAGRAAGARTETKGQDPFGSLREIVNAIFYEMPPGGGRRALRWSLSEHCNINMSFGTHSKLDFGQFPVVGGRRSGLRRQRSE